MALFQGLRDYWAERALLRIKDTRRRRKVSNLHQARDVGFLYCSDSESKYLMVKQFAESLRQEYGLPHIFLFGFVPEKDAPHYHTHKLNSDYFTLKDVNWCGRPSGQTYEQFLEREFDILIDLSQGDLIPLRFALHLSKAALKAGRKSGAEAYDLTVSLKEDVTLDAYMLQIERLLSSINHHEERQRV